MTTKHKNKNSELVDLLKINFGWHLERIKFFEKIICALISVQTVCYSWLAEAPEGNILFGSKQRRILQLFADFDVFIARNKVNFLALKILNREGKREYVIIASLKPGNDALLRNNDRCWIETMFED